MLWQARSVVLGAVTTHGCQCKSHRTTSPALLLALKETGGLCQLAASPQAEILRTPPSAAHTPQQLTTQQFIWASSAILFPCCRRVPTAHTALPPLAACDPPYPFPLSSLAGAVPSHPLVLASFLRACFVYTCAAALPLPSLTDTHSTVSFLFQ